MSKRSRYKTVGDLLDGKKKARTLTEILQAGQMQQELPLHQVAEARKSFAAALRLHPEYRINWHHEIIINALERVLRGETTKLLISTPPQVGKTYTASTLFPAYCLGRGDDAIFGVAYNQNRANSVCQDVQRVLDSTWYKQLFPEAEIPKRSDSVRGWKRSANEFNIIGREKKRSYLAVGVGGSGTGYSRSLGIVDDVHKNMQDALSPKVQQTVKSWWSGVYSTRQNKLKSGGKPIRDLVIATRWSTHDLIGWLLDREGRKEEGGQWEVISLPALMDDLGLKQKHPLDPRGLGESIWPDMISSERLDELQQLLPSSFDALYQGRPKDGSGGSIRPDMFKRFTNPPGNAVWSLSMDLTFGSGDGTSMDCILVWAKDGNDAYLVDMVLKPMAFTETLALVKSLVEKYPITETLVEDKAAGRPMIEVLKRQLSGVIPVQPDGAKEARFAAAIPFIEAGNVHVVDNPTGEAYIREMIEFKPDRSDCGDASSQYLRRLKNNPLDKLLFLNSLGV